MKKTYKKILSLIGFCGLMSFGASAQISGVVTINSGAATGGTNYQSFSDLATALNTNGVNGPLTVNVALGSGPYVEQVTLNQITGMTATNRVIINGNGATLTFNSTSSTQPWTLGLNGTDYLTVDNLKMYGTGTTYALVCKLSTGANFNTFSNCVFECNAGQTSTSQCPFSISSNMTSATAGGTASGNYNTVKSSTLSNGYYSYVSYGNTSAPNFTRGNSLIDSRVTDWYAYGPYFYYNQDFTMKGCIIDRLTRTASTTMYPYYAAYNNGCLIEGNLIHKLFESNQGSTATIYMYMYYQTVNGAARNVYRNNIITDIKWNGSLYPYSYYGNWDIVNNTFDYDWTGGNHTGTMYAIYPYQTSVYGPNMNIKNNIITIRKPGAGTRYGIYSSTTGGVDIDKNNIIVASATGNNYIGYYSAAAATQAAWQSQGQDLNGFNADPQYVSAADLHPTNAAINNMATPMGIVFDQQGQVRHQNTPDIGALEFMTPLCSGTPTISSVASPTYVLCPGEVATFGLSNLNASAGITYSWQASQTSAVGPWTMAIQNGATGPYVTSNPITSNTWYNVVMTCTVPGGGSASSVGQVVLAGSTTSTVPYYEGFEGIGRNNRLPNCSWSAPTLGDAAKSATASMSGNRVARTGSSFAYFDNGTTGTNYYYTNSITMNAGITYSAALWYATEYLGNTNWTSLEILVGPNQSTTGLVSVASVGPAASGPYKLLSNVFTVPSTGLYYVAIKATSAAGAARYLSWDDLSITIPCDINGPGAVNAPTLAVNASAQTVCANEALSLSASGADTYTWSTGANTSGITENPTLPGITNYIVWGTNALTGCTSQFIQPIMVNPSPLVLVSAQPATVCVGQPVTLMALGNAVSYLWSNGLSGAAITITVAAPTNITLIGTGSNGCAATAVQAVSTFSLPTVSASSSNAGTACNGDMLTLTGNGAVTYEWINNVTGDIYQGTSVNVYPSTTVVYTITGIGTNGCSAKYTLTQNVEACVGINENKASLQGLMVYPNPANDALTVELNNSSAKTIEVLDLTGRVVLFSSSVDTKTNLNIQALANGVYYVKVKSNDSVEVIKIVKQ